MRDSRAWLREVVSGTLRWRGRLDMALDSSALKKKPSGWLRRILLVGVYQLIAQERTLPAAVVSETVDAIRRKEGEAPARFANAILRKVSTHAAEWRALPLRAGAGAAEGARWASLPEWYWSRLQQDWGREWSEAFAVAALERPRLWLRARRPDWMPEGATAGPVPGSWELPPGAGSPVGMKGFEEGEFMIQDISSQFLVQELTRLARQESGEKPLRLLDLCAAPGGKSVGMAWNGFEVVASDTSAARLELLAQTLRRSPGTSVRICPAEELGSEDGFDCVWVDAPCSGSGIIRRHPDIRWIRREAELDSLSQVQADLLLQGWRKLRPGGILMYSVCSVFRAEGENQIENFQKRSPGSLQVLQKWILGPHLTPSGDGFWACALKRT